LPGDTTALGNEDRVVEQFWFAGGDPGQKGAHIGVARGNRFLKSDFATQLFKRFGKRGGNAFSKNAAVVNCGSSFDLEFDEGEQCGNGALKFIIVAGAQIPVEILAAIRSSQRRSGV
jgi:hypothetical protein